MLDIECLCPELRLDSNGIWQSPGAMDISYPEQGNKLCLSVEDDSFWFRHRNACIKALIETYPPPKGGPIVDIGGGNGYVAKALLESGLEVIVVEPGPQGAVAATQRGLKNVICATFEAAEFSPSSLPAVGFFDVLEHIEDDVAFLKSIHSCLTEGGRAYMTVPAYSSLWSSADDVAGHFRRHTLKSLSRRCEAAGLKVEFATYFFQMLPPAIFLFRTIPYRLGFPGKSGTAENVRKDHITRGSFSTRIVNTLLRGEPNLIRHNSKIPFGASCMVVARKE